MTEGLPFCPLMGERQNRKIAYDEKVFSIFEPHTRWIAKGKAGVPVCGGGLVKVCPAASHHVARW